MKNGKLNLGRRSVTGLKLKIGVQLGLSAGLLLMATFTNAFANSASNVTGNSVTKPTIKSLVGVPSKPKFSSEILVKIKASHASQKTIGLAKTVPDEELTNSISGYSEFKRRHKIKSAHRLFVEEESFQGSNETESARVAKIKEKYSRRSARSQNEAVTPDLGEIYTLSLDSTSAPSSIEQMAKELAADPAVEYAVPNHLYHPLFIPSDPLYPQQWAHIEASAQAAWDIERGSPAVTVAILDMGVDYTHPDLVSSMLSNCASGCAPGTGYDFVDINVASYTADGWTLNPAEDYVTPDTRPMDFNGHGTHCAGIVAASQNNGKGISGIAPGVKIMPIRAGFSLYNGTSEAPTMEADDVANAIRYAADNGADILNMSFDGLDNPVVQDAVNYAASLGVVLIAAAGNWDDGELAYPASNPNVIAVGALAQTNLKAKYSSFGKDVDISAPGGDPSVDNQILSTVPLTGGELSSSSGYRAISGSSTAAPYVAGVAALILSRQPTYTAAQVKQVLLRSVDNLTETTQYMGTGKVNAYKAVTYTALAGTVDITSPVTHQVARNNATFSVLGTAQVAGGTYQLSFGTGLYPTSWTQLNSATANIVNGTLGSWPTIGLTTGFYTLKVSVQIGTQFLVKTTPVYVDNFIRAGWPQITRPIADQTKYGSYTPTLYDIDNDGSAEIFIQNTNEVLGFRANGTKLPGWPAPTGGFPQPGSDGLLGSVSIGDLDNDGAVEICAVINNKLFAWTTSGTYKPGFPVILGPQDQGDNTPCPPQLVDLDNNGTLEIVVKGHAFDTSHKMKLLAFTSNGILYRNWPYTFANGYERERYDFTPFQASSFIDIDQDGFKEVIGLMNKATDLTVGLFIWNYDGTLKSGYPKTIAGAQVGKTTFGVSPLVTDLDNDGELEIGFNPIEEPGSSKFAYIKLDGTYKSGWPVNTLLGARNSATVADLDKDGILETIVTASNYTDKKSLLFVFRANGTVWPGYPLSIPAYGNAQVNISDIDNDGWLDLVYADFKGNIHAWNRNGVKISEFPKLLANWGYGIQGTPAIGDIDGDGLSELVASTYTGETAVWELVGKKIPGTTDWPQILQNSKLNLLSNSPIASSGSVGLLGSWVQGATRAKEAGSNRALVVMVYAEGSNNMSISSVKYGGRLLTKVSEKAFQAGAFSYTGAFVLDEAGITAATNNSIAVTWATAPTTGFDITSAFMKNVNQSAPIGASSTGSTSLSTITTGTLETTNGDMVILGATAANNGTYTMNNGFSRGIPETSASFGDITSAYKVATATAETPSITMNGNQRQTMVSLVLKKGGSSSPVQYSIMASAGANGTISPSGTFNVISGSSQTFDMFPSSGYEVNQVTVNGVNLGALTTYTFSNVTSDQTISVTFKLKPSGTNVAVLGSWVQGTSRIKEAGSNRALVVMVYGEGSADISASGVSYGGQPMTKVVEKSVLGGAYSYTAAFILKETGVAAATSNAISITWSKAPSTGSDVVSAFLSGVNQANTIGASGTGGSSALTVSTPSLATAAGDMVLVAGTAGGNGIYTLNNGFSRGIAETSATFGDITSGFKSGTGSNETPSLTSSISQRQSIIGFVVKK